MASTSGSSACTTTSTGGSESAISRAATPVGRRPTAMPLRLERARRCRPGAPCLRLRSGSDRSPSPPAPPLDREQDPELPLELEGEVFDEGTVRRLEDRCARGDDTSPGRPSRRPDHPRSRSRRAAANRAATCWTQVISEYGSRSGPVGQQHDLGTGQPVHGYRRAPRARRVANGLRGERKSTPRSSGRRTTSSSTKRRICPSTLDRLDRCRARACDRRPARATARRSRARDGWRADCPRAASTPLFEHAPQRIELSRRRSGTSPRRTGPPAADDLPRQSEVARSMRRASTPTPSASVCGSSGEMGIPGIRGEQIRPAERRFDLPDELAQLAGRHPRAVLFGPRGRCAGSRSDDRSGWPCGSRCGPRRRDTPANRRASRDLGANAARAREIASRCRPRRRRARELLCHAPDHLARTVPRAIGRRAARHRPVLRPRAAAGRAPRSPRHLRAATATIGLRPGETRTPGRFDLVERDRLRLALDDESVRAPPTSERASLPSSSATQSAPVCARVSRHRPSIRRSASGSTARVENSPAARSKSDSDAHELEVLVHQARVLVAQPATLRDLVEGSTQGLAIEGLEDVVGGAELHRLDGGLHVDDARHHHDVLLGQAFLDPPDELGCRRCPASRGRSGRPRSPRARGCAAPPRRRRGLDVVALVRRAVPRSARGSSAGRRLRVCAPCPWPLDRHAHRPGARATRIGLRDARNASLPRRALRPPRADFRRDPGKSRLAPPVPGPRAADRSDRIGTARSEWGVASTIRTATKSPGRLDRRVSGSTIHDPLMRVAAGELAATVPALLRRPEPGSPSHPRAVIRQGELASGGSGGGRARLGELAGDLPPAPPRPCPVAAST